MTPVVVDVKHEIWKESKKRKSGEPEYDMHDERMYCEVPLMQIPVMVRSKLCNLYADPDNVHECPMDQGGYFIINGSEKTVQAQEKLRTNYPFVFKAKGVSRHKYVCEVRSLHEKKMRSTSTINTYITGAKGVSLADIQVMLPFVQLEIPIVAIFIMLGFRSPEAILKCVFPNAQDPVLVDTLRPMLDNPICQMSAEAAEAAVKAEAEKVEAAKRAAKAAARRERESDEVEGEEDPKGPCDDRTDGGRQSGRQGG